METKDFVQEYAQSQTQTETPVQSQPETQTESSLTETPEATSVAPESASNESAYESLLTGKPNVQPVQESVQENVQENVQQNAQSESSEPAQQIMQDEVQQDAQESIQSSVSFGADEDVIDEDDFIKTKTDGKFSTWEELTAALEQQSAPKFENEMSEQVYNMLLEGKTEELFEILGAKQFAEQVKEMSDEEVLKSYIKANNPDFDDDDVDAEYQDNYTIDEYSFDESKLKREQKKLSQRIKSDVQNAKEFFDSLAQEIKLPELSRPAATEVADQGNEQLEAEIQEMRSRFLSSLDGVENRLKSLSFQWKDDKANVAVNGKFDIPAQELSQYREAAQSLEEYQLGRYYKDGQYLTDKMVRDLYVADNFDKILTSAISQAVNQTRLEMLKQSKNIQSEQEPTGTFRPSAADEEKALLDQLFMGHLKR